MSEAPNVATMQPALAALEAKRELVHDLMGGTTAMIAAGTKWLPKHNAESEGNYKIRKEQNILTNFLEQAVRKGTGKILSKPIQINDNVPDDIQGVLENIDRQGSGLDSFMRRRLDKAFEDGISYILADTPKADGVQTKADEKAAGIRPYAVPVDACNLLEVMAEVINGVETLTRIRIMESVSVPDGEWGFKNQRRVRVLRREPTGAIVCQLWNEVQSSSPNLATWVLADEWMTGLKRITLVPIYTNRCGFMQGEPPFQETAELNLEHWRSKSEQLHALSFGRFAMLHITGTSEDTVIEVGPSKVQKSSDPNAKCEYVESTGAGLDQGWKHLEKIESAIDSAQAKLKIENAGRITATAAAIDSADSNAGLLAICQDTKDNIETLLMYFAEMMGLGEDAGGEVEIAFEAGTPKGTDIGLQELGKAAVNGTLSRKQYLVECVRRGELPEDFDYDVNETELSDQRAQEPSLTPPTAEQVAKGAEMKKKRQEEMMKGNA